MDAIVLADDPLSGVRIAGLTARERAVRVARRAGAERVLVVDDSITVREVERQLLRNEGYDVAAAVDGDPTSPSNTTLFSSASSTTVLASIASAITEVNELTLA